VTIACPDCGALEDIPPLPRRSKAICQLCRRDLEKTSGRSISAALACSLGTFLLLFPANILPLIRVGMLGMQAETSVGGGIAVLWTQQWVVLSGLTAILVIVVPFIRFGLLTAVLGALKLGYRPSWLGQAFRWAVWLEPWGMPDVFMLACLVGYYRLFHLSQVEVSIELGGACFIAAGFLTMLSRAALDRRTVWRALGHEVELPDDVETLSCTTCDLIQPISSEGEPCPRCGAKLQARKRDSMPQTAALVVASFILFFPANILPMNLSSQLGQQVGYTIFTGVRDLFGTGRYLLGASSF
jgi:paraquat-inducible protein A